MNREGSNVTDAVTKKLVIEKLRRVGGDELEESQHGIIGKSQALRSFPYYRPQRMGVPSGGIIRVRGLWQ